MPLQSHRKLKNKFNLIVNKICFLNFEIMAETVKPDKCVNGYKNMILASNK